MKNCLWASRISEKFWEELAVEIETMAINPLFGLFNCCGICLLSS